MSRPRILIAGAGYAGLQLAKRLAQRDADVFALRRRPGQLPTGCESVVADLTQADGLSGIPSGLTGVAFCAAASRNHPSSYADLFIKAQQNLIQFLHQRGDPISRYVMMSTTGVYGDSHGDWIDESTEPEPNHPGPADILAGEKAAASAPFPTTVVRFSGIYGPGRHRLIRAVRNQQAFTLPGDPVYLNQIHVDDVAGVLEHLLFHSKAPTLVLASDMEPTRRGEVLAWIAEQIHAPPPIEDADRAPQPRHGNKRCRNTRLLECGYTFQVPTFREGYGRLLLDGTSNE